MLSKLSLWIFVFIVCILTACSTPSTPGPRSAWFEQWLKHPTCSPPCWEGITPGVSKVSDALDILNKIPGITKVQGPIKDPLGSKELELDWDFQGTYDGGTAYTYKNDEGVISTIGLGFHSNSYKVKEVIDVYGDPSHLIAYGCRGKECDADLVYADKGLMISTHLPNDGEKVRITPNAPIDLIAFFPGGGNGYQTTFGRGRITPDRKLLEWKGYAEYPMQ